MSRALAERVHAECGKERVRLFSQLAGTVAVALSPAGRQQAGIVEVRAPQLWPRAHPRCYVDGCLKVGFGVIPPVVEGGGNTKDTRE